jgi:hypothetical protein
VPRGRGHGFLLVFRRVFEYRNYNDSEDEHNNEAGVDDVNELDGHLPT